jgi:hypothetical protein
MAWRSSGGFLRGGEHRDVVFVVDGIKHFESPLFRALRGHDIHHSAAQERQGNSARNRRWRMDGDDGHGLARPALEEAA